MNSLSTKGRERFAKVFTVLTSAATVLSLSGVAYLAPVASAVAPADYGLTEGNTISAAGSSDPDVYIINELGYKRLFLNPVIFSFYGHLGGFAAVKTVSPTTRDAFGTSGLFRNCETNDPKVYGLGTTGEDTAMLHWVNTSGAQAVADDPNFFKKVFCINNNEFNWYPKGADYNSVNDVPVYVRGGGVVSSGPLSVNLASTNPAPSTLLEDQSFADLAHFQVNGTGRVTKVVLDRLGISGDDTLENVYLFVNGYRVSDGNTFSNNTLTFNDANGFFNAPATVVVRGNLADSTSGKTVGVRMTMVNDSTVSASGNLHSIASENGDLSDISISSAAGGGSLDPQADVTLWQGDLSSGVNAVYLKRLTLRLVGSAQPNDFANFRLYVDGVQVATSAGVDGNDYVNFLANYKLETSAAGIVKVVGDIVGGAGKTYKFELRGSSTLGSYDIELVDADYMVGAPLVTGTFPFGPATGTIGAASLTIVKATDSPSGDVVLTTDDFTLAKYTFTSYGEAVKIETLVARASISGTVANLRDGRLLINGTQYGSTQTLTEASVSFTVNYTLQPGSSATVELRADAKEVSGTALANGDIISGVLETGEDNAEGLSSGNVLDAPSSDLEGNNRTVATGSLSLAKDNSFANQTLVVPTGSIKIGDYVITGSNTEGANLTTFTVTVDEVSGTTNENELRDMFVKYGAQQTSVRSTVNATQDFSVNFPVAVNQVVPVEVWAQILSTASTSGQTFKTTLDVAGSTTPSGTTIAVNATDGQTHTIGAGSFSVARDTGVANSDQIVGDEQTVKAVGYEFTAVNENYKISRLQFTMPDSSGINEVRVMDGTTIVMSLPASVTMTFNIAAANQPLVTPSSVKELSVDLVLATIASPSGGASGANHTVTLVAANSRKVAQSSGTETAFTGSNVVGKALYVYKAVPTITRLALPSTALANGTRTLAKFNVGSGGTGTIGWSKAILAYSATGGVAFTDTAFYDAANESTPLAGTVATASGIVFTSADELPAGDYVVKATVYGATGDDAINVSWEQSGLGFAAPTASASVGATDATFVWTDRFSLPHTDLTPDWNNDNLVKNLPLDSWAQSD